MNSPEQPDSAASDLLAQAPVRTGGRPTDPLPLELRRHLQRLWERARDASGQSPPRHDVAHHWIVECVVSDPATPLYVDTMLRNLERKHTGRRPRHGLSHWFARRAVRLAWRDRRWLEILQTAPPLLATNPWDLDLLQPLADACQATGCRDSAWLYLQVALRVAPDSVEVQRRAGRVLTRLGRFPAARRHWVRVQTTRPDDAEARRFLEALPESLEWAEASSTTTVEFERDLPRYLAEGRWADAEQSLQAAHATATHDLRWKYWFEELTLARHRRQIALAEAVATQDPDPDWLALVAELRQSCDRVEVEVLDARCRRYPEDAGLRLELGRRLRAQGRPADAARYFQEASRDPQFALLAHVEEGECWQKLHQFDRAWACYVAAIHAGSERPQAEEAYCRALYRAAVLAEPMGRRAAAREYLEELLKRQPGYRDAAGRLDKLRAIDDNSGSARGRSSNPAAPRDGTP